jgi:aminoglycoside 3-N-acetyltransferase
MNLRHVAKRVLPPRAIAFVQRAERRMQEDRLASLAPLHEGDFLHILTDVLGLEEGETVFLHSSVDQLHLAFPFGRVLSLLQRVVGDKGTLLLPTAPRGSSFGFLASGMVFDVRKTPSFTGMLTELARRQRNALRSFHPTKSVCAIGARARELTKDHQWSPYPYDRCSPYYKITECGGKIVGLGVSTRSLSFVHCVDDALKQDFPVRPYHDRLFEAKCISYDGELEVVKTYAHDMNKMIHNVPRFIRRYISPEVCEDLELNGRQFFRAHAAPLFESMLALARVGVTIYPRSVYSDRFAAIA